VEIDLMSFKHPRMINSASKCLKITLKFIKFSKPENNFPKKLKLRGISPLESFEGGGTYPPTPLWRKPCIVLDLCDLDKEVDVKVTR
jgi:hypothetical protein